MWMGWVQSKFVIVKNMKELRFGGGVNTKCADLWTSKQACVTVTMLPICVSLCLYKVPQNQTLCNKRSKTCLYNFFCSISAVPDPLPCPNYRGTICPFIAYHFWAALEPVWLKLPLGPGDLPACSLYNDPSPGSTQTGQSTIKSLSVATNSIQPISLALCKTEPILTPQHWPLTHLCCGHSYTTLLVFEP